MSLRLPSEIVVDRFLPTARAMLALELNQHGLTQQEIADHLGVTQAAVSKYLSGNQTTEHRFENDSRMIQTISRIAEGLSADRIDEYEALDEMLTLIRHLEDRGPICEIHEEIMPALRGLGCDLCVRGADESIHVERDALGSVRKAARILATTPGLARYIPNVGTNVVTALPDATDATDVAGIPGRIYAVGGRVEIPANPEFGASQHVATIILAAHMVDPNVRGTVNIATNDELLTLARDRGLDPVEFDANSAEQSEQLYNLFEDLGSVPRVLYHTGAFGIEPITYVFGETGVEAAELVASLVHRD